MSFRGWETEDQASAGDEIGPEHAELEGEKSD
jgi:hypothetical protein